MPTSDPNLNPSHMQDGCLTIEFLIGTPEGQMPNRRRPGKEVLQADLSFWCGLNHFNSIDKDLQALLRDQIHCMCILADPVVNMDLRLSKMGIVLPRIGGNFGNLIRKASGIISKCNLHDTWHGLNRAPTRQLRVVCVTLIKIHKFALAGKHFNLLGTRMGANGPSIPNEVISTLRAITGEICEALKGTLPTVLLLENECCTDDPLPGRLGVAGRTYEDLISIVLRESNTTRVYPNACVQVHMRSGELLKNMGVQYSKILVTPVERGIIIEASWKKMMHTKASNRVINGAE